MEGLWRSATHQDPNPEDYEGIDFWSNPERSGWLTKHGEYLPTWRRRWFIFKQGKLFLFKDSLVSSTSTPRGVIPVGSCVAGKGADDVLRKPFSFQISTTGKDSIYFIADSEREKEEWINSIGRSAVQHSSPNLKLLITTTADDRPFRSLCTDISFSILDVEV